MHRRRLSRLRKILLAVLLYITAYLFVSYVITPAPLFNFVSDDVRIGDKYIFIYLSEKTPIFSDVDGAELFRNRSCKFCFMTNNKGFMALSEYDAVVMYSDRSLLHRASNFMERDKRYIMETHRRCLEKKLMRCATEPMFKSFDSNKVYDVCGLCRHLHNVKRGRL